MSILWMLIVGLFIGALARWIMPGDDSMNLLQTCLLGVAGGLLGGYIGEGIAYLTDFYFPSIVTSIGGGILILWGFRHWKQSRN